MEIGETATPRRQRINVRRAQQRVPCTPQVVGPVLVGDEQKKIGPTRQRHQSALMFSALASWP
jgi:hypothetical protein